MRRHDLERIRRSLAMSPSLTPELVAELATALEDIIGSRREVEHLAGELERLGGELRRLAK